MDPIESWLDAKEVRRMAEELMAPVSEKDQIVSEAGYGNDFEGFTDTVTEVSPETADALTRSSVSKALANAKNVAENSGMLDVPAKGLLQVAQNEIVKPDVTTEVSLASDSPPLVQDQEKVDGVFLTGVKKFSDLLRKYTDATAMFLIDNQGEVFMNEVENAKLIGVAQTLMKDSASNRGKSGEFTEVKNVHIKTGTSSYLEIIPCNSSYGPLILGVICPAPMGVERIKQVVEHFEKTVESDKES